MRPLPWTSREVCLSGIARSSVRRPSKDLRGRFFFIPAPSCTASHPLDRLPLHSGVSTKRRGTRLSLVICCFFSQLFAVSLFVFADLRGSDYRSPPFSALPLHPFLLYGDLRPHTDFEAAQGYPTGGLQAFLYSPARRARPLLKPDKRVLRGGREIRRFFFNTSLSFHPF